MIENVKSRVHVQFAIRIIVNDVFTLEYDLSDGVDEEVQHRPVEFVGDELGYLRRFEFDEESTEAGNVAAF